MEPVITITLLSLIDISIVILFTIIIKNFIMGKEYRIINKILVSTFLVAILYFVIILNMNILSIIL